MPAVQMEVDPARLVVIDDAIDLSSETLDRPTEGTGCSRKYMLYPDESLET